MVVLPGTLEERLIRRLLDEGMLEQVRGLWQRAALVEHLSPYELHQAAPQLQLIHGGHGPQQLVRKLAPDGRSQLRHDFRRRRVGPGVP